MNFDGDSAHKLSQDQLAGATHSKRLIESAATCCYVAVAAATVALLDRFYYPNIEASQRKASCRRQKFKGTGHLPK